MASSSSSLLTGAYRSSSASRRVPAPSPSPPPPSAPPSSQYDDSLDAILAEEHYHYHPIPSLTRPSPAAAAPASSSSSYASHYSQQSHIPPRGAPPPSSSSSSSSSRPSSLSSQPFSSPNALFDDASLEKAIQSHLDDLTEFGDLNISTGDEANGKRKGKKGPPSVSNQLISDEEFFEAMNEIQWDTPPSPIIQKQAHNAINTRSQAKSASSSLSSSSSSSAPSSKPHNQKQSVPSSKPSTIPAVNPSSSSFSFPSSTASSRPAPPSLPSRKAVVFHPLPPSPKKSPPPLNDAELSHPHSRIVSINVSREDKQQHVPAVPGPASLPSQQQQAGAKKAPAQLRGPVKSVPPPSLPSSIAPSIPFSSAKPINVQVPPPSRSAPPSSQKASKMAPSSSAAPPSHPASSSSSSAAALCNSYSEEELRKALEQLDNRLLKLNHKYETYEKPFVELQEEKESVKPSVKINKPLPRSAAASLPPSTRTRK